MQLYSGKDGAVTIAGSEPPITQWSVNPTNELQAFRNSLSGNYTIVEPTFKDATFEINIDYDFDNNPFASPINIDIGTELTQVKLFLHGKTGDYWHFPKAVVTSTPQELVVDGKITTRLQCRASAAFGRPGNPVV